MEQPRDRDAAAEGSDGPGGSRDSPGGTAGDSAAWNGTCGRAPGPEEDDDDRDPGPGAHPCSCRYRGEPAAPPSPAAERRDRSCGLSCRASALPPRPGEGEDEEEEDGAGKGGRRLRRRPRHRSTLKEKEEGSRREGGAGKRNRPARKRSRGDGTEGPAEGPAGYRGLLALGGLLARGHPLALGGLLALGHPLARGLARACRLGTEAVGQLLCSCCRLGEPGSAPAGVWGWSRRVGQRARSGSLRAARWLRAGAGLFLRLLGTLGALLLLLLALVLRLCERLGRSRQAAQLWALLDVATLRRTWGLLGESRLCRHLGDWLRRRREPPWVPAGGGPGDTTPVRDAGAGEEVRRLLAMAEVPEEELNPFQVLGVEATASDADLKKAYRRLAVLVHPDKNEHPRAEAAFKVLRAAWDIVSSPERRKEYELKRMAESELTRSMSEFLSRLQDDLREAMNTMMCSKCQGKHKRFEMDRDPLSARYCAECGGLHPAEEGDFWAESSLLGLKITYFAMMDGKIYDITEWAGCQRVGISPDTHRVPYHISFGSRSSGRQRSASKGGPTSAADLQDFFTRVFQGSSGQMPGGPFPPPPTPPGAAAPPGVPPRAEGAAPKGDAKHKRRKKVRRPLQR